jgi:hypothetical protein
MSVINCRHLLLCEKGSVLGVMSTDMRENRVIGLWLVVCGLVKSHRNA